MNMPFISVIIPVYNAGKYLEKCLNSLLEQSLPDFEVICVNDGSKDNSWNVLNKFASKDARIKVFSQENSGPARARNLGLENASGDYVWFIDADDWCSSEACRIIKEKSTDKPDIILFGTNIWVDGKLSREPYFDLQILKEADKISISSHPRQISKIPATLWNKVYRREFLTGNNIRLDEELRLCDDNLMALEAYLKAKSICVVHENLYNYQRANVNSLSTTNKNWLDVIKCSKKSDALVKKSGEKQYYPYYVQRNIDGLFYWLGQQNIPYKRFYKQLHIYFRKLDKSIYLPHFLQNCVSYEKYLNVRNYGFWASKIFRIKIKDRLIIKTMFLGMTVGVQKQKGDKLVKTFCPLGIPLSRTVFQNYYRKKYICGLRVSKKMEIGIHERFVSKSSARKIKKLKNKYLNKGRLFIIGNGKSIKDLDLRPLNEEYTFVVSRGYLLKDNGLNHASFYCMCDRNSYTNYGDEIDLTYAGTYFASTWSGWDKIPEKSYLFDLSIDTEIAVRNFFQFDITQPLALGRTVVLDALQLAVYMGFKEIYFIGVDLNFNDKERHFYKSNSEENQQIHIDWAVNNTQRMINNFGAAAKILSERGVHIFNAGIGGNLNSIPRVSFGSLFEKGE